LEIKGRINYLLFRLDLEIDLNYDYEKRRLIRVFGIGQRDIDERYRQRREENGEGKKSEVGSNKDEEARVYC